LSLGELKALLSNRTALKKVDKIVKFSYVDSAMTSNSNITSSEKTSPLSNQTSLVELSSMLELLRAQEAKPNEDLRSVRRKKLLEELKKRKTSNSPKF
jgi:hypothetical protein